jgi:ribosome-binding factor A
MRVERVAHQIKKEVSHILAEEFRDPRLGFVTVIDVDVTADLREAKVYFSILGSKQQEAQALKILNNATSFIRKLIGQRLKLRLNPQISFKLDKSIAQGIRIEQVIREIKDEKKK